MNKYKSAFVRPGARSFVTAGFIFRFPMAIYPIALVLIISGRTGEYGFAGVVSGAYVIGGAIGNPVAGTLVDRLGQHRVLPPFLAAQLAVTAVMTVLISNNAPLWTLPVPSALMGLTLLNVGALTRARWSHLWPGDAPERSTGYSVESTLDELIFVLGPLTATVLATHARPLVTLAIPLVLVAFGSIWLTRLRDTEPPVTERVVGEPRDFALRHRGMVLITLVMVFMGAVFGSAEVVMVAFCGQHGSRASAGWVIACFAGGSGLAGLLYGARHWQTPLLRRFVISSVIFGVLPFLYFAATSVLTLAFFTAIIGLGIAPTLISGFGLVDSIVPARSLTEGLTWIGTGLSVGYGFGAALVGGIADAHGARPAFAVPVTCAVIAAGFALLLSARLGSSDAAAAEPALVG
ncbi:MFS transporter [Jatrophihabitans sp. DSM 45814]